MLSVEKTGSEWGGLFLTSQIKREGLQWDHWKRTDLFARRGNQKCSLQLHPGLRLTHRVSHFANATWNLRDVKDISDPIWKYPLFSYLPRTIMCNQCITVPAEGAFHLFIFPFCPHYNFWHDRAWMVIAYSGENGCRKKRERLDPEKHPQIPVPSPWASQSGWGLNGRKGETLSRCNVRV